MSKRTVVIILSAIFICITGFTFTTGIVQNPNFNVYDFCAGLSSEFIGWILAVTIFQYYYDAKLSLKGKRADANNSASTADEILKFKNLLDSGAITQEEYEQSKNHLLEKMTEQVTA